MIFGETDESNPFVPVEQMMPFVPFVRCRNVDEAIEKARISEHGFRHTAIIHSTNVHNMTKMGKAHGYDAVRQERSVHGRRWATAAKDTVRTPSPARPARA